MMKLASATVAAIVLVSAASPSAEAKDRLRERHATQIEIVDWRAPRLQPQCAAEVYPYAPSACLPGGFIAFDGKAYFAPRYGYRAQRYVDGW